MWIQTLSLLINPLWQTLYMVCVASVIAVCLGLPLGVILFVTRKQELLAKPKLHFLLSALVSGVRSIPFIILMIAIIPLTRFLIGTSIGTTAAIVPLTLSAIPFVGRVVETALCEVADGLIEAAKSMGASQWQIITKVLIPEALPGIWQGITLTVINLVGYSAMAGAIGGGGLGDLAIRYGYQRFDMSVMVSTIIVLILLVQLIQMSGDGIVKKLK